MAQKLVGLTAEGERSVQSALQRIERRLGAVEKTPPVELALIVSNFVAFEGQTLVITAPSAGVSGLLPKPRRQNRFARIHLVFTTSNGVALSCDGGTVNGQSVLTHDVPGAYTAVCDGLTGWWLESLELAAHLRGTGLTVDANGNLAVRQRPRSCQVRDYFLSGTAVSGSIGSLGWNLLGTGTPAAARQSVATGLGTSTKLAISTSAATNDRTVLALGETETRDVIAATDVTVLQCVWNHNNNLTNKRAFFGLMGTFAVEAAAAVDALGIYYDSGVDAHYQIIARDSSSGTPTVTTASVPANTGELLTIYQGTAGTFAFYVGNTLVGSISSGIPTSPMNLGFRLETLTTAAKTTNLGYFGLEAVAGAAFDDDSFLEA